MNKTLALLFVLAIGVLGYLAYKDFTDIKGCYVAAVDKDVYTLQVINHKGDQFGGWLSFKNYQMDSTSGPFNGTYKDDLLLGQYSFESEGTKVNVTVAFKKGDDAFIRGTGAGDLTGLNDLVYDESSPRSVFKKTKCQE